MITLSKPLEDRLSALQSKCLEIEKILEKPIDTNSTAEVNDKLSALLIQTAYTSRMIESATIIYDTAKSLVFDQADSKVLDAKQNFQKLWIEGMLSKYNGLYVRVEQTCRSLERAIDGLRSILSLHKEEIRNRIAQ